MFDGIINVYKEPGFTSHDVVAKLRGILKQKKIGHTGTLDPDASGVLPVCLGQATKLCDMLTDKSKEYRAVLLLGITTDTEDTSGQVTCTKDVCVDKDRLRSIIEGFVGEYDQIPPMYSAIKIDGKKLYEIARAGKEVERKPRHVVIDGIDDVIINLPRAEFTVRCSKGTYIRSLCRDIGEKAGCGGCMEKLVRTRVGQFRISDSVSLSQIEQAVSEGTVDRYIVPVDSMFSEYPELVATGLAEKLVRNGNLFRTSDGLWCDGARVRVYINDGETLKFAGIYEFDASSEAYRPVKMFLSGG